MSNSDDETKNKTHKYHTRSKSIEINNQVPNKVSGKKKIPVVKTSPKRQSQISNGQENKDVLSKSDKSTSKKKTEKYKISTNQIELGNVIGELFVNQLVEESNKLLKKKRKAKDKSEKKDKVKNDDNLNDIDKDLNIINEIDTDSDDDDSDQDSDFSIEGLPEEIEYTEEERNYILKLSSFDRDNIIKKEKQLLDIQKSNVPIRFKILGLKNLSNTSKQGIIARLDHFYTLDSNDSEYSKLYMWVECLERMPFDTFHKLPVCISDSYNKISSFLLSTRDILDEAVYGHVEAKEKIITTLSKQISNPEGVGICIGIQGPMGNGKTTLVKEGICRALKRPFGFIALGGAQDSSYMLGHDYTYEGSKPGKIVEILGDTGCMNPVIYFDELDKLSSGPKGDEIANFLCHLTDTSQNSEFQDKYLSRVKLDMSKAIFIFSYNDTSKVNPILLDRLYKIKTEGFDASKKLNISKEYLIPKILKDFNLCDSEVTFTNDVIKLIIEKYAEKEEGVRNLKRCLETIVSKINVLRFVNNNSESKSCTDDKLVKTENHVSSNKEDDSNTVEKINDKSVVSVPIKDDDNDKLSDSVENPTQSVINKVSNEKVDLFQDSNEDIKKDLSDNISELNNGESRSNSEKPNLSTEEDKDSHVEINDTSHNSENKSDLDSEVKVVKDASKSEEDTPQLSNTSSSSQIENKSSIKELKIMSEELEKKVTIKLNIEEIIDDKPIDCNKIISLKINKFKIPFEVNCDNVDKFLKSNDTNTSFSHLYL